MTLDSAALRIFVYDVLLASGRPPSVAEIAARFAESTDDVRAAMKDVRIGKTLLVHPGSGEVWMAGPFSAAPTPYRVVGRGRSWWANCAWDMLGIPIIAGESVDIDAMCTDCGAPMHIHVDVRAGPDPDVAALVHFLVPARRWYEDIGFT